MGNRPNTSTQNWGSDDFGVWQKGRGTRRQRDKTMRKKHYALFMINNFYDQNFMTVPNSYALWLECSFKMAYADEIEIAEEQWQQIHTQQVPSFPFQ